MRTSRLSSVHRVYVLLGLLTALCAAGCSSASETETSAAMRVTHRLVPLHGATRGSTPLQAEPTAPLFEVLGFFGRQFRSAASMSGANGELRWPVELAAGSRLRFGCRVAPTPSPPSELQLTVSLRPWSGPSHTLWERRVDGPGVAGRLMEAEVELPATGRAELVFSSHAADTGEAVISWVSPMVLAPSPRAAPSVLVLCIDTLRADRFESFGGAASRLPRLDERLASAARFTRAYANSPWSLPSMATILTGLTPSQHNAGRRTDAGPAGAGASWSSEPVEGGVEVVIDGRNWRFQMLHDSIPTLQELLGEQGYLTTSVYANGFLNPPTRALKGMDVASYVPELDAALGTDLALELLRTDPGLPRFQFLHYMDPHQWPAEIREELQGVGLDALGPAEREEILATYDALCERVDVQIERFFATAEEEGLLEDAIVVLLADHGETFFERDIVGGHGSSVLESVLRVPLAIWAPGLPAGDVPERVSLVDVLPTIIELLDLAPPSELGGRSLVPLVTGSADGDRSFVSEFLLSSDEQTALYDAGWKLVRHAGGDAQLLQLDVTSGDTHDRSSEQSERFERMLAALETYLEEGIERFVELEYEAEQMDEETWEALRKLGYVR